MSAAFNALVMTAQLHDYELTWYRGKERCEQAAQAFRDASHREWQRRLKYR